MGAIPPPEEGVPGAGSLPSKPSAFATPHPSDGANDCDFLKSYRIALERVQPPGDAKVSAEAWGMEGGGQRERVHFFFTPLLPLQNLRTPPLVPCPPTIPSSLGLARPVRASR